MEDEYYDGAYDDEASDKEAEQEAFNAALAAEELRCVNQVLNTKEGRRVIYRILCKCGIYNDILTDSVALMNRELGRRSVGLEILTEVLTAQSEVDIIMRREDAKLMADLNQLEGN